MSEELSHRWESGQPVSRREFKAMVENIQIRDGSLRRREPFFYRLRMAWRAAREWMTKKGGER